MILPRLAEVVMPTVDASTHAESVKEMLAGIFTVDNLKAILVVALTLCANLALFWFGYRFIKRRVVKAMTKGSL